ncbi:TPA: type II toxin-antitoxin system PemK/MazF family toxin [Enterobacter hormaechei]
MMATASLRYYTYDANNQARERLLGIENVENIDEMLIPINEKNTPIFITKAFTGIASRRWRVEFVLGIEKNIWGVWLSEKDISKDVYLSQTMKKRSITHAGGIVKRGCIVIVEFGHIYLTLNFSNGLSDSSRYPCYHQSGEMHKRRPAIVVSADKRGVKVVPITSQEPDGHLYNRAIFELESASTTYISEFKRDKPCFALCEMIQTVSPTRILPPEAKDMKSSDRKFRRDESYNRKLSTNDLHALEEGLLTAVGMASLRKKNDTLLGERDRLKNSLDEQGQMLVSTSHALEQTCILHDDFKKRYEVLVQLYLASSGHTSLQSIEAEISEYL